MRYIATSSSIFFLANWVQWWDIGTALKHSVQTASSTGRTKPPRKCSACSWHRPVQRGRRSEESPWSRRPDVPRRAPTLTQAASAEELLEAPETPIRSQLDSPRCISENAAVLIRGDEEFDYTEAFLRETATQEAVLGVAAGSRGDKSVWGRLSLLALVVGAAAVAFAYGHEHGMTGLHWSTNWVEHAAPHPPPHTTGDDHGGVRFTPLKSVVTGLGAGFTRAVSRTLTFPLDTLKTRSQVSRLGAEDRAKLPEEMRRLIERPASFDGMFKGFSAFLAQAGPSNAVFFLVYDALNTFASAMPASAGERGGVSGLLPAALFHLGASSLATVPSNLVKTPAEVVKQRLQVGQETGSSLEAFMSIVKADGVGGLFVGGKEQLIREIPFNAIQFTVYEGLKACAGGSELWADAALGAASSAVAAVATQPVDTVKTRVMTKSVPGAWRETEAPGFLRSATLVAETEGASSLFLGLLPRLVLVSTGGAFYFWGEEFASMLMSRAGV